MRPLIIASFAGGGGTSEGIRAALGRDPDYALNHHLMFIMHRPKHLWTWTPKCWAALHRNYASFLIDFSFYLKNMDFFFLTMFFYPKRKIQVLAMDAKKSFSKKVNFELYTFPRISLRARCLEYITHRNFQRSLFDRRMARIKINSLIRWHTNLLKRDRPIAPILHDAH